MSLRDNVSRVLDEIGSAAPGRQVTLVAVTKTHGADEINPLAELGRFDIGENRVQEWLGKRDALDSRFRYHQIGQLQSNKVRYIAADVHMIHSVDRLSLAEEIDRRARACGRVIDCLIQVNTAREPQKGGVLAEDLPALALRCMELPGICLRGLMCIAPLEGGIPAADLAFAGAEELFHTWAQRAGTGFDTLSMGMSGDYQTALRRGANMVRIGSALFGPRA